MPINKLLFSDQAKSIYDTLKPNWSETLIEKYQYLIANYCNELALFHRIEKELAEATLTVDHTNSRSKTNKKENELLKIRNESQQLLLKIASALMMTPRTQKDVKDESAIGFDLPNK